MRERARFGKEIFNWAAGRNEARARKEWWGGCKRRASNQKREETTGKNNGVIHGGNWSTEADLQFISLGL